MLQWITQVGDHCLEITQYQTYYLLLENYPDDIAAFVTSKFDEDVASGSYLNTIPEPSRSEIRTIYPVSSGEEVEAESSSPAAAWKPTEPPLSPIVELPDDSGGAKTGAIAGGVTVALLVAIVGLFVARRRMVAEAELKDDELDDVVDGEYKNSEWSDDDSSSSGSSRSSSSSGSSSSASESAHSTSGSSDSYYSNSGSTSGGGTSVTGGENGPLSVSASDNDSSASHPREPARAAPAAAKAAIDILNSTSIHDSMDSGSSVGEASLVEEAAIDEIDSDSDQDSHQSDEDHHQDYEMNVDLTDADGLEIPQMGRRSKESSYADDSSAGSSGWNSSVGDSSSTNTESVESFDANMVDVGSSTISKTNTSSDADEIDEYAIDRELLPGVNPAVNPVVQPGLSMLPVDDMGDDDSDFSSDDSENSTTLTKRNDTAPLGREIQSAIEQGDWSAVGATAAMIALLPDEDSTNSASMGNTTHTSEMEALVNSGNWSGIVAVAARYADDASIQSGPPPSDHGSVSHHRNNSISSASVETADESSVMTQSNYSGRTSQISNATESEYSASSASYTGDSYTNTSYSGTGTRSSGTGTNSGTYETGASASEYTSEVSRELTNPSEDRNSSLTSSRSPPGSSSYVNQSVSSSSDYRDDKQRISAFRAEVEALVRRVVPDEIDNVDAIMIQFSGREEELIATLRGMQEKTIAQRAKAAVQRSAKKERGGRMPDDYTESSEEQSSVRDSTFTGSATSVNDPMSMASASHSITEEFVDDSSRSGSESGSEYSSESANETEEGSRSEYSQSASEYTSRSEYSQSYTTRSGSGSSMYSESQSSADGYNKSNIGSVVSQDISKENPDELDNLMDSGDWHGIVDHAKNMRGRAREDLD
jgi:hypothetical protein